MTDSPASGQDVTLPIGDSRTIRIKLLDGSGQPITDITNAVARWWMAKKNTSTGSDIFLKKSTLSGGGAEFDYDGTYYYLVVPILPLDTEHLPAGRWYHEAEIVDADGDEITTTIGKFTLTKTLIVIE